MTEHVISITAIDNGYLFANDLIPSLGVGSRVQYSQ